ncbi:molybdate ABC transporter substrate-binding protein [Naasia sp. SYSU D00057]|uniref:molybdate ABC transporter substrate-binding protein n=1 Tax=Naasia sp. SYSU D00057 TaxID=2817380 RepID=UPI001B304B2C|nr:molybdate ABC transporter substrate-binding protein [Naasia sp. SYSU D00057]
MRRRAAPAAIAALAAAALVGCASTGAGSGAGTGATAGTVSVFAAASLTDVLEELADRFEAERPGVSVVLSFGGSSGLAAQLTQGAPADVFAAASEDTMAVVADAGLLAGESVVVARNVLEIAVPPGNPAGVTGLADLARPELAIALCDESVPCGAVASRVLAAAGVQAVPDTLEQDVRAVLTKVELGEVDAGLVYRTDVLAAGGRAQGVPFPEAEEEPTDYPIAVLDRAADPELARAFARYVAEDGRSAFEEAGFAAP